MEARGFVTSKLDAFKLYLAKGGPAYVDRFRFSPEESIGVIVAAGGVPVLSHPLTLDLDKEPLRQYVEELCGHGLQGIEAYYPEHSQSLVKQYLTLAREFDLVVTGGSDFHGEANKAIRLGSGFGSLNVPDELVEPLRMRAAALGGKTDNETGALGEEPA
jgi:predicted metal-dependent phosphoesterase TrpH